MACQEFMKYNVLVIITDGGEMESPFFLPGSVLIFRYHIIWYTHQERSQIWMKRLQRSLKPRPIPSQLLLSVWARQTSQAWTNWMEMTASWGHVTRWLPETLSRFGCPVSHLSLVRPILGLWKKSTGAGCPHLKGNTRTGKMRVTDCYSLFSSSKPILNFSVIFNLL